MNFRGLKVVNKHCSSRLLSYPVQRWNLSWVGEKRQLWNYNLCDPIDCSPPGSSVHGILQARILECVALASSRGSSQPRDQTHISYVSCIGRRVFFFYHWCHLGSQLKLVIVYVFSSSGLNRKNTVSTSREKNCIKERWTLLIEILMTGHTLANYISSPGAGNQALDF